MFFDNNFSCELIILFIWFLEYWFLWQQNTMLLLSPKNMNMSLNIILYLSNFSSNFVYAYTFTFCLYRSDALQVFMFVCPSFKVQHFFLYDIFFLFIWFFEYWFREQYVQYYKRSIYTILSLNVSMSLNRILYLSSFSSHIYSTCYAQFRNNFWRSTNLFCRST